MPRVQAPSTPASARKAPSRMLLNSSPLEGIESSPASSPTTAAQARRRSQYKVPRAGSSSRSFGGGAHSEVSARPDEPHGDHKALLRTRLKLRCIERANKARERAVQRKRYMSSSDFGSDDIDIDGAEDDDDAFDELHTRVMKNAERKIHHAYMYSYDREVGSDPVSEDFWEKELNFPDPAKDDAVLQAYLDEEEAALAEDQAAAAFADFADIPADELFGSLSDFEGDVNPLSTPSHTNPPQQPESMDVDTS